LDYIAIIKRAFKITVRYRALWLFGFFLALCSGSRNGGNIGSWEGGGPTNQGTDNLPFNGFRLPQLDIALVIAIVAGILLLVALLIVVGVIVRSVSRAAIIGMVEQVEETGRVTVRDGWRWGWSRRAWRIFLINLIIGIPLVLLLGGALVMVVAPVVLGALSKSETKLVIGIFSTVFLLILWVLVVLAVGLIVSPLSELGWRLAALRDQDPVDSLGGSFSLIRKNVKHVAITVLLLAGIGIGWAIASIVLIIVAMLMGGVAGVVPALIGYWLTQELLGALLAGLPVFLVVMIVPLMFVTGLCLVFRSAVWTLVFRNLMPAEPEALPEPQETDPLPATTSPETSS